VCNPCSHAYDASPSGPRALNIVSGSGNKLNKWSLSWTCSASLLTVRLLDGVRHPADLNNPSFTSSQATAQVPQSAQRAQSPGGSRVVSPPDLSSVEEISNGRLSI
jgi:hypothetical protein